MSNNGAIISFLLFTVLFTACSKEGEKSGSLKSADQVSYNFHVRPILSDNCFACHGPDANKREAGLRLDEPEAAYAALKDNPEFHAIVPGDPNKSEALRRILSDNPDEMMPPPSSNLSLTEEEISILKRWISQGAKYEPHWAFVTPVKSALPNVKDKDWPSNEIDYFVWDKMRSHGLKPNPEASKVHLLKRLSLDLTGLPPDPRLMEQYVADEAPDAYERMVDHFLEDPAYGEKLAILWMDISRYSDSYGYQDDNVRTQWPYRDWVIHAFNKNLPYDQFITWQLAGDLLPNANKEQILATAFNRNHKYTEEGGVIDEEYRVEYVVDKTNTFSKAIIGMTVECAQCHDHKYDPISQENYFQLYAFFNNTPEKGYEGDVSQSKPAKTPILFIEREDTEELLSFLNKKDTARLMVSVMEEFKDTVRQTFILNRGLYDAPTTAVSPATPASIMPFPDTLPKNRLGLAQWTVAKENPLTARVFVNLIWQEIFGTGLVKTAGDFGMQGDMPTHPELLDWLAVDFMENGWDIKRLIKLIVTSSTYKQSAIVNKEKLEKDPDNVYLSSAPRLRLNAENIRDLVLASSGLLIKEIGGPSVKPYQPDGLWEAATSGRGELAVYRQDKGEDLYRRGLYTFIKLTSPPPSLAIFDASNRDLCEVTRGRTNTPLQALVMLNDPLVLEASRVLATRLMKSHQQPEAAIEEAFKRIVCRFPEKKELTLLSEYYQEELKKFKSDPEDAENVLSAGEYPMEEAKSPELAALMHVVVALYNLEETITKT
ncbi:MAG TPA: PSD1 and planctomycete cytochrome C domain-containing protein [Cyclobacteriaceae bacterium]|nr:PSD1 and planctomycete cytochrome C domain-containing protein [Cyclobacteriaceae bacterium]